LPAASIVCPALAVSRGSTAAIFSPRTPTSACCTPCGNTTRPFFTTSSKGSAFAMMTHLVDLFLFLLFFIQNADFLH
jgi:hypothetical protein